MAPNQLPGRAHGRHVDDDGLGSIRGDLELVSREGAKHGRSQSARESATLWGGRNVHLARKHETPKPRLR